MKISLRKFALLFPLLLMAFTGSAQYVDEDEDLVDKEVVIIMDSGNEYRGIYLKKEKGLIYLETEDGDITLEAYNVDEIVIAEYAGVFDFANPNPTRYFFAPSAIPLGKYEGYYQNIGLLFNFGNVGITENVSVGGGFEMISTLVGYPIWFFTPKVGFEVAPKTHVGGGLIMLGIGDLGSAGIGFGSFTYGTNESNFTMSLGYGFASGSDELFSNSPTISVSGTHRLTDVVALLSENYFIPDNDFLGYFGIQGIRLMTESSSFDIGLIIIPEIVEAIIGLPFVGYTYSF